MILIIQSIVGLLAGILSSMGLGAGTVLILYLSNFTNLDQTTAQGINLLFFLPISCFALYRHKQNNLLQYDKQLLHLTLLGAVGAIAGSYLAHRLDSYLLYKIFGAFLLCMGVKDICKKRDTQPPS